MSDPNSNSPEKVSMRSKVRYSSVVVPEDQDTVVFIPACKYGASPEDGSDEDNTFAGFSPSGEFKLTIQNPALLSKFRPGKKFYVDFTEV
jgi:hypothetical protein